MSMTPSERRLVENQMVFRSHNEKVQQDINRINETAAEVGDIGVHLDADTPLFFYCECSDENCTKRIKILPAAYNLIHSARDTFTVMCGHDLPEVERVIIAEKEYCVVQKYDKPPLTAERMNVTDVDNS
jgi:hypothetical protein